MHEDLLHRAIQGDEKALRAVLEQVVGRITGIVRTEIGDFGQRANVDEIVPEVLLKISRKIATFQIQGQEPMKAFDGWVLRIAKNAAIDWLRKRTKGLTRIRDDIPASDPGVTPARAARIAERIADVDRGVRKLDSAAAKAVRMRYFEGMKVAEIARVLDRPPEATKKLLQRALKRLAADMSPPSSVRLKPSRNLDPP